MKAVLAQWVSCCVFDTPKKFAQHVHGNIPYMVDCWANTAVHLLLLKSSTTHPFGSVRMVKADTGVGHVSQSVRPRAV